MARATRPPGVSQSEVDHFNAIPWCRPTLDDTSFHIVNVSRTLMQPGHAHSLMGQTLNTPDTIAHLLSLYRPVEHEDGMEIRRFYTFGTGLNAHANLLHGGVIANILDSSMSNAAGLAAGADRAGGGIFTVELTVRYKKAVVTPGSVLVRARVNRVEGEGKRKIWVVASVEDGLGGLHATAEGLWLNTSKTTARL